MKSIIDTELEEYTALEYQEDRKKSSYLPLASLLLTLGLLLMVAGFVGASVHAGYEVPRLDSMAEMMRLTAVGIILFSVGGVLGAYLYRREDVLLACLRVDYLSLASLIREKRSSAEKTLSRLSEEEEE